MSAARRVRRAGRNLLIALVAGAVVIAAIVIAYVAGRSAPQDEASVLSGPPQTKSATAAPSSPAIDAAPTGCLGGQSRDASSVLNAQRLAPNSTFGAVEVATTFYRWVYRFPLPSSAEIATIGPAFVPGDAAASEASLRSGYAQNSNPSLGAVGNGTPFYLSSATGEWVASQGAGGAVRVSVEAAYVVNGALSATKTATASFDMKWVNGRWRVAGLAKGDESKLATGGTAFTAGC